MTLSPATLGHLNKAAKNIASDEDLAHKQAERRVRMLGRRAEQLCRQDPAFLARMRVEMGGYCKSAYDRTAFRLDEPENWFDLVAQGSPLADTPARKKKGKWPDTGAAAPEPQAGTMPLPAGTASIRPGDRPNDRATAVRPSAPTGASVRPAVVGAGAGPDKASDASPSGAAVATASSRT